MGICLCFQSLFPRGALRFVLSVNFRSFCSPIEFVLLLNRVQMQVHTLVNPTMDSFRNAQKSLEPNILYFQGEQLENEEEIGTLFWGGIDVSEAETFSSLMAPPSPTIVSPIKLSKFIYQRNNSANCLFSIFLCILVVSRFYVPLHMCL